MIAYEIQLRYVIRDKIQSEAKYSPRQNSVREKSEKNIFCQKKNLLEKNCLGFCLGLTETKVSDKSMIIITKRFFHTTIMYIFQCCPGHGLICAQVTETRNKECCPEQYDWCKE